MDSSSRPSSSTAGICDGSTGEASRVSGRSFKNDSGAYGVRRKTSDRVQACGARGMHDAWAGDGFFLCQKRNEHDEVLLSILLLGTR